MSDSKVPSREDLVRLGRAAEYETAERFLDNRLVAARLALRSLSTSGMAREWFAGYVSGLEAILDAVELANAPDISPEETAEQAVTREKAEEKARLRRGEFAGR